MTIIRKSLQWLLPKLPFTKKLKCCDRCKAESCVWNGIFEMMNFGIFGKSFPNKFKPKPTFNPREKDVTIEIYLSSSEKKLMNIEIPLNKCNIP